MGGQGDTPAAHCPATFGEHGGTGAQAAPGPLLSSKCDPSKEIVPVLEFALRQWTPGLFLIFSNLIVSNVCFTTDDTGCHLSHMQQGVSVQVTQPKRNNKLGTGGSRL
jgi:hypothetical protein